MKTVIINVDSLNPEKNADALEKGAAILKKGGLVAFPTETVYGLGANALDPAAVSSIYAAKGRPGDNPLIVHIYCIEQLNDIAKGITPIAKSLIKSFWPGPLTIILEKKPIVPYETTGGLNTVAVRLPQNKIAQLLLEKSQIPIAAPSANISGRPSPTEASHVITDLDGKIDMIIDGGDCVFGLESTVVDATGNIPIILRPGSITADMIERVCGSVSIDPAVLGISPQTPKAPGQKYRHYSPKAHLTLFRGEKEDITDIINALIKANPNKKIGVMCADDTKSLYDNPITLSLGNRNNPKDIGANLFKTLRQFDLLGVDLIYSEAFPEEGDWLAITNRLKKAEFKN